MRIDLQAPDLLRVSAVPAWLTKNRPSDKRVHRSTVMRWITKGVGGLRLDADRMGGRWYTTISALHAFVDATTDSNVLRVSTANLRDRGQEHPRAPSPRFLAPEVAEKELKKRFGI